MEPLTWLSLGLQLGALCSIVGALLLYLLKKVRGTDAVILSNSSKTVLITSVDTALGLQIATYLSSRGWRVIGGCKNGGLGARLASSWTASHSEGAAGDAGPGEYTPAPPKLATVELDVAREDLLEQAARATAQHLPAGEHGVWAVINTAGWAGRGGAACWDGVLRANVLGALRVARTFTPLLSAAAATQPHAGRLFYIGLSSDTDAHETESVTYRTAEAGETAASFAASRWAVWGACGALRGALRPRGIHVVVLHAPDLSGAELYAPPALLTPPSSAANSRPETPSSDAGTITGSCSVTMSGEATEYSAKVLPTAALRTLEEALTAPSPRNTYYLKVKPDSWFTRVPSLRMSH